MSMGSERREFRPGVNSTLRQLSCTYVLMYYVLLHWGSNWLCFHHNLAKQGSDEMFEYSPAVSRQRSQRDFCFRSLSGHLHEHCVQSQDSKITFAIRRRSKICQCWTWGLQKYFSSGQSAGDSRWSRLFAGFCLGSLDMQPV